MTKQYLNAWNYMSLETIHHVIIIDTITNNKFGDRLLYFKNLLYMIFISNYQKTNINA